MFKRMQSLQMQALHCFQTLSPSQHEYRAIIALHNTDLGPALGGCRCLNYSHEQLAFDDAMRLAQGMSYKAALANVPQGGGKAVIMLPNNVALDQREREFLFSWFGQCVEQLKGQYITAMDVGTQVADMDVLAKQTCHVASASNIGDPASATAKGVMVGIRSAVDFYFNGFVNNAVEHSAMTTDTFTGKTFAIQGLGHVGWRVAQALVKSGATVIAADPDKEKCQQAQALGITIVSTGTILTQTCDVLVPCALGGIIDGGNVNKLRCRVIAGSANNQLASDDIAKVLAQRNILYAPDYIINAGGLIFASLHYCANSRVANNKTDNVIADEQQVCEAIDHKINEIYATLMAIFKQAKVSGKNVNQVANELALQRLHVAKNRGLRAKEMFMTPHDFHSYLSQQQALLQQQYLIKPVQYLANDGELLQTPASVKNEALLMQGYRWMNLTRAFDQKAVALQRTGIIGTYPSSLGQEAIAVACGLALEKDDVFVPYYRDHGALLVRGHLMEHLLLYWGGDERGSAYTAKEGSAYDMPVCVPIATQASHAVGIASALKIQQKPQAVLCTLGDGATSKGDFLEALNLAGSWHLPVVFVINNNQWAISVPRHVQSGAPTLAQKGLAAAIPSIQVDGNDFIATFDVISEALSRARKRKGPMLIEAISYRLSDHTTADDASRYRVREDVETAWKNEPIKRLQQYIFQQGYWNKELEANLQNDCQRQLDAAVKAYQLIEAEQPEAMFDYLYETWPVNLDDQVTACSEKFLRNRDGGDV